MKRVLITGSAGFVGRHFSQYLSDTSWDVTGQDIATAPWQDSRKLFRNHDVKPGFYDLVIHCAAVVGGRKTIDGAPLALASNLELDAGLFQWALRNKPGRVIYFSSSAAYPKLLQQSSLDGNLREHSVDPSLSGISTGIPDQLYGWAKLTGENLAWRAKQEGLKVSVVRPFSGYGEDQDACYPFPAFTDRALRKCNPFQIWGDGTQTRDFIHIDDIVQAVMTMANCGIDGPVNLGNGRPTTLNQLAELICRSAGYKPEFLHLETEPSGVNYRVSDNFRLLEFYTPEVSLEEGIHRALAYRKP